MNTQNISEKPRRLHLGCGQDIRQGYLNVDKSDGPGVDQVCNLDKYPWPFEDNTFDEVLARDVIEHLRDLFKAMQEIKRICKPGAKVRLIVPYWHSSGAFYPNHYYFFNIDGLKFFTEEERGYDSYPGFRMKRIKLLPSSIGRLIPPLPLPKRLFPNALDFRHLVSYLLGEIILKIDFTLEVREKENAK